VTTSQLPTTERLARALESLNDPALAGMIAQARAGYYDDYKSSLAMPQVQLVLNIRSHGHPEFAKRVIDGEFDATLEEGEAWINSLEGQAALAQLTKGKASP
jgi:hypothetical protein